MPTTLAGSATLLHAYLVGATSDTSHRLTVAAHRGSSHTAPENTLPAMRLALEQGADGVEFDIYKSADGDLFLLHDSTLKRTAAASCPESLCGDGGTLSEADYKAKLTENVQTLSYEDFMRHVDVGEWKGAEYAGVHPPRLAEVMSEIPAGKYALCEIKGSSSDTAQAVVAMTATLGWPADRIKFIGFSLSLMSEIKQLLLKHGLTEHEVFYVQSVGSELRSFEAIAEASANSLDGVDFNSAIDSVTHSVARATKGAPIPNHICKECCENGNCKQSVQFGDYVSFQTCQQQCEADDGCIGIEYGNNRGDSRCTAFDQCLCFLVTGACSSPGTHLGYSVYLKVPTPSYAGMECCAGDNCDQSELFSNDVTLDECGAQCDASESCIGVEYGNDRSDKWGRCTSPGRCTCYLIGGQCSNQKGHLGFNVYLKNSRSHDTEPMTLGVWAGADTADLLTAFDDMGADFFTSNLPDDVLAWMAGAANSAMLV